MTVAAAASVSSSTAAPVAGVRVAASSAWLVLVCGAVGLIASVTLTVEKIRLLADPAYVPSCNLNPVLSCGSVMATEPASLAGVPNSLVGIAAFTVVLVTGLLSVTKVPLPQWYWTGLSTGTLVGVAFVHWLIFVSLYRIGALCPYCMAVWAVTIPLLVVVSSIAFASRRRRAVGPLGSLGSALYRWRWSLTAVWFTVLIVLIAIRFEDYWSTLI